MHDPCQFLKVAKCSDLFSYSKSNLEKRNLKWDLQHSTAPRPLAAAIDPAQGTGLSARVPSLLSAGCHAKRAACLCRDVPELFSQAGGALESSCGLCLMPRDLHSASELTLNSTMCAAMSQKIEKQLDHWSQTEGEATNYCCMRTIPTSWTCFEGSVGY